MIQQLLQEQFPLGTETLPPHLQALLNQLDGPDRVAINAACYAVLRDDRQMLTQSDTSIVGLVRWKLERMGQPVPEGSNSLDKRIIRALERLAATPDSGITFWGEGSQRRWFWGNPQRQH